MCKIKKKLGKRIRELRRSKVWTQEVLAEKIGIETASLSNIENGKTYPSAETIENLIKVFKINPYELFIFEHLEMPSAEKLIEEMNIAFKEKPELVYKIYNIFKVLSV